MARPHAPPEHSSSAHDQVSDAVHPADDTQGHIRYSHIAPITRTFNNVKYQTNPCKLPQDSKAELASMLNNITRVEIINEQRNTSKKPDLSYIVQILQSDKHSIAKHKHIFVLMGDKLSDPQCFHTSDLKLINGQQRLRASIHSDLPPSY